MSTKQLTEVFSSVSTKNPPDLVGSFSFRFLHSFSLTGFLLFFAVLVLVDVVVGVDTGEVNNGGENSEELLDEGGEEVGWSKLVFKLTKIISINKFS